MHITTTMVKEALHKAVEEKGEDHIAPVFTSEGKEVSRSSGEYGSCQYHDPKDYEKPSCIAGNAFHQWGILSWVGEGLSANEALHYMFVDGHDVSAEEDAATLLQQAQELQDSGIAWGQVVESLGI